MSVQEFRLPDVGEGLTEAEILSWHVAPGDEVELNAIVVEIETAKSAVELPSPFAGTVIDVLVAEGESVEVGSVLLTVASVGEVLTPSSTGSAPSAAQHADAAGPEEPPDDGSRSVLVGYGPTEGAEARRLRRTVAARSIAETSAEFPARASGQQSSSNGLARAKPPVRKLAREMGIDLGKVKGSGPQGTVTRNDLRAHQAGAVAVTADARPAREETARSDDVRIPVRGVRKATAQAMVASAFTAPHVTEFLTVDVTAMMDLVGSLREDRRFCGVKITPLLIVARAVLTAVRAHPDINASWDEEHHEIVQKTEVNLGIAAATPRGLLVPNIKQADRLSTLALAKALTDLTAVAREGKTSPDAMAGGTITITNVGVFGVDAATPILNPGEAAILCFGAVKQTPWVHDGQVVPRWTTQLSLSFDHRLVDGALGSTVLALIGAVLEDPLWRLATT